MAKCHEKKCSLIFINSYLIIFCASIILGFKLKQGNDSVLQVTKENYNQCNTNNPIKSLTKIESELKFERSGPHYFISGNEEFCKKGQKLIIVVHCLLYGLKNLLLLLLLQCFACSSGLTPIWFTSTFTFRLEHPCSKPVSS